MVGSSPEEWVLTGTSGNEDDGDAAQSKARMMPGSLGSPARRRGWGGASGRATGAGAGMTSVGS